MNRLKSKIDSYDIIIILVGLIFLPLVLLMTDNIGGAAAFNGDIVGYMESIKRFHYGIMSMDFRYALDMLSYGYGAGMFLLLAIITLPFSLLKCGDTAILILIRSCGLISLLLSFIMIKKIYIEMNYANNQKLDEKKILIGGIVLVIILTLMPTTSFLITRVHPEILQFFIFLCGIYWILRYDRNRSYREIIISSIFFGIMVGVKISGALYVLFPILYFINVKKLRILDKIKLMSIFGLILMIVAIIVTCPLVLVNINEGIKGFIEQLKHFSNTLKNNSISDFDNYRILDNKKQVIWAWCSYIYRHGYISVIGIIMVLINIIKESIKELKTEKNVKYNTFSLTIFIFNSIYYMLFVTRVSTYYYYIPICLLFIMYVYNKIINYNNENNIVNKIIFIVLVILFIPSLQHDIDIYKEQIQLNYRLKNNEFRYEKVKNLIKSNKYPNKKIMLPTSSGFSITTKDLNWIPYSEELEGNSEWIKSAGNITSQLQFYWTLEDILSANPQLVSSMDIFMIDKKNEVNYSAYVDDLIENGMSILYEDNYSMLLSKNSLPIAYDNINEILINNFSQDIKSTKNNMKLNIEFNGEEWESVYSGFSPAYDMSKVQGMEIEFYIDNIEACEQLRVVINGYCETINENTWDYIIDKSQLKDGYNKLYIPKEKFNLAQGYINWNYITNIVFGGEFNQALLIKDFNISIY